MEDIQDKKVKEMCLRMAAKLNQEACKNGKWKIVFDNNTYNPVSVGICQAKRRHGSAFCRSCSDNFKQK